MPEFDPLATRVGRVTRDPETKTLGGKEAVVFPLAVTRYYDREREDRTEWVDVAAFGDKAKASALSLRKGNIVGIEGNLRIKPRDDGRQYVNLSAFAIYRLAEDTAPAPVDDLDF